MSQRPPRIAVLRSDMAIVLKKPTDSRHETDESLRTERDHTDRALARQQSAVEDDADVIVKRARRNADAVLSTARDKADRQLDPDGTAGTRVAEARATEDDALRDERAVADATLRAEREENACVLARLLPLEREKTDRYLLTERARSDDAVSNRDDFLGMVSHDLRNLLGGIVMSADLIADTAFDSDAGKLTVNGVSRIQRYAARMNRLIADLVDVSAIDAGILAMTKTRVDARAIVMEAVETFRDAAAKKGIVLDVSVTDASLDYELDRDRVLQVLVNLITNAIKFTDKGTIHVRCEHGNDELRFSVEDSGIGIPTDMLERVFERFWQVGKNDRRGAGLGLYISRCIVEAHGGKIVAQSKLGEGSRLSFALPTGTS